MLALQGHMEHSGSSREEAGLPGNFLSAVPRILTDPVTSALRVVARAASISLLPCRIPNLLSLPAQAAPDASSYPFSGTSRSVAKVFLVTSSFVFQPGSLLNRQ